MTPIEAIALLLAVLLHASHASRIATGLWEAWLPERWQWAPGLALFAVAMAERVRFGVEHWIDMIPVLAIAGLIPGIHTHVVKLVRRKQLRLTGLEPPPPMFPESDNNEDLASLSETPRQTERPPKKERE